VKIVGLTGGIGSGKTTVAGYFKELGIPVYIADEAGKDLMKTSAAVRSQIIELLGEEAYRDNIPNRKYIAARVFASADKLESLNQIIHPAVKQDFENWKQGLKAPYVIYEAAILFETGGYKNCDLVILVTAPLEKRIERLQKRDHSTTEEIQARMKHQWADDQKRKYADYEILNSEILFLKEQVQNLHEILLKASKN